MGKGENAGYQHFLLFPQCFQKASNTGSLQIVSEWERVNPLQHDLILDMSTLKALAVYKSNVTQVTRYV